MCREKCEELEQLHLIIKQLENIYIYSFDVRKEGRKVRLVAYLYLDRCLNCYWTCEQEEEAT